VLDAKWKSKQWQSALPKSEKDMPGLELGLLIGISNGEKFAAAMKEYRTTLNEFYEKIRETVPNADNLPGDFKLTAPETEKGKNGTLYHWPIPIELLGVDKQFQPTIGVGKSVSVLTLSKEHTERLLSNKPLAHKTGPLARKGDLIGFAIVDWPAFVDAALPWVEFSIANHLPTEGAKDPKQAKEMAAQYVKQAAELARILKCYKGAQSATYLEGGKLVTHVRKVIKDLDAPAGGKD
jgi:hypothetical protein